MESASGDGDGVGENEAARCWASFRVTRAGVDGHTIEMMHDIYYGRTAPGKDSDTWEYGVEQIHAPLGVGL